MCCLTPIDYIHGWGWSVVLRVHGGRWLFNPVRIDCWDVGKHAKNSFISKPSISICALKPFLLEFCVGCLVQHSKCFIFSINIYIYKLFGYKFPLKYVHVILESPSMWCFFFWFFLRGCFWNLRTTWPWIFHIYRWRDNNVNMFGMWWKQTPPLHEAWFPVPVTAVRWTVYDLFFLHPPWFFQKSGGGIFQKTAPNAWWYTWRMYEMTMQKDKHKGNWCCTRFLICLKFFDDTANQTHKVVWKVLILPGSK